MIRLETIESVVKDRSRDAADAPLTLAVIWIDWYAYHIARFRALASHPALKGRVAGIELVGKAGVHGGLVFRDRERESLRIDTLAPSQSWAQAGQRRLARLLWKHLSKMNPDVVLVPGYYTIPGLASVIWARAHGKTAILMTESTRRDQVRNRFLEAAKGVVLRNLFHGAIAGGKRQISYLEDLGFVHKKIGRCYDVVDNDYFRQRAESLRRRTRQDVGKLPEKYFLYVGRLAEEKNIDGLIRAFAAYRQGGGDWYLVVVGDGQLKESLESQAEQLNIQESVYFEGLKNTSELVFYYAHAGCFVLPSWREPWGLVVNEAMAAQLPLIVSDRCGCSDDLLEEGQNGYRFDPDREEELRSAMCRMSGLSYEEKHQMGERSAEIIARYSLGQWAAEVVRIASIHNSTPCIV